MVYIQPALPFSSDSARRITAATTLRRGNYGATASNMREQHKSVILPKIADSEPSVPPPLTADRPLPSCALLAPATALAGQTEAAAKPRPRGRHEPEVNRARRLCQPWGSLEWVVSQVDQRGFAQTYYVLTPDPAAAHVYERAGIALTPGIRVVFDAVALRPVAVLPQAKARAGELPSDSPCGFNPYWDIR